MRILYFASVREQIGQAEEEVMPPPEVTTAGALIAWLSAQNPRYAAAFAKPDLLRIAINQRVVKPDASLAGAIEVAVFPPMTGG